MAGKHEIDAILRSVNGIVRLMGQQDHGLIRRGQSRHGFVQLGEILYRTTESGEPEARAVTLEGKRAVGQRGNALNLQCIDDHVASDQRVVIAE